MITVWVLFFGLACGGGSSGGGTGTPPASPAGGCTVSTAISAGVAYCIDFVGTSWDPALAESRCDLVSDDLVAGGSTPATYEAAGCPGGATAECTGFEGIPGDSNSEIVYYYYEDPPMVMAESGCTDGGGTYTLY